MKKVFALFALFCLTLGTFAQQWAQVNVSIANVRTTKGQSSELCTQEYMGMPVQIIGTDGDWSQIVTTDGYKGWVYNGCIVNKTDAEMAKWKNSPRLVVNAPHQITVYTSPNTCGPRDIVTDLVRCDIVEGDLSDVKNSRVKVTLPDGRQGWAPASAFVDIKDWANKDFDAQELIDQAYYLMGTPYLWGGNSVKGLDCSGLAKLCYLTQGVFLLRDASMQARTGTELDKDNWQAFQTGDLLFFGSRPGGKVTHVAVYDKDGWYVHSSGRGERVGVNSIDPNNDLYVKRPYLKAVRIHGNEGTEGITKASAHPWLF